MIPYIFIDEIKIGFLTLHFWGIMVSLGFIVSIFVNSYFAKKRGFSKEHIFDLSFWIIICSLLGGRLFHIIFYDLGYYLNAPIEIFKIWNGGMSVTGGFLGAFIAGFFYFRKHDLKFLEVVDNYVFALPLGLAIGRIGCAFIHDHPGIETTFFLGVNYPSGIRHDLGLYLSLYNFAIFLSFLVICRKYKKRGILFISYLFLYGIGRFLLDFLRTWDEPMSDSRYFMLTPAQYFSIVIVCVAIFLFFRLKNKTDKV